MQIQFLDAPEFAIDRNGVLRRSGSWLLSAAEDTCDIAAAAESWAGTTGSAWRKPTASGEDYTLDPEVIVTSINCQALDSLNVKVTFQGTKSSGQVIEAIKSSYRFERRKDLSEYKIAQFEMAASDVESMPKIGDLIDWAGENYRCESAVAEAQGDEAAIVTLTAVNIAVELEGRIESVSNAEFEQVKVGTFLLMPDALEAFLERNSLHSPAEWAGENFYIFNQECEVADSALRTRVILKARYVQLQMIENLRSEEIVSLGNDIPEILYIWSSRWRAAAGDQAIFEAMLGTAPVNWGHPEAVICQITPKRISDCEFEYQLEARLPETVGCSINNKYWQDRDLPDRREYYARVGEMRFSPVQCGYTWRSNGNYTPLNNWQPAMQCPLNTTNPLPQRWINQPVKMLEIVEVTYLKGVSSKNMDSIVSWFTGGRVSNTTLIGITGSFLRYDLDVDDVIDSRDRKWTRITKAYRLAPGGFDWSPTYWI